MRFAVPVVLGVIAATGCEQILGLKPVTEIPPDAVGHPPDATPPDPCDPPIASYSLDGSAMDDASGHHYNGMIGVPGPTVIQGHLGAGYSFDGSASVTIAYPNAFQVTPLTVSLWFQPQDTLAIHCLVNQLVQAGNTLFDDTWQLCLLNGQVQLFGKGNMGWSFGTVNSGQWQHLVLELDGSNATLWLNGVAAGSAFVPSYDHASSIMVGADVDDSTSGVTAGYVGTIDELKFFHCSVPTDRLDEL